MRVWSFGIILAIFVAACGGEAEEAELWHADLVEGSLLAERLVEEADEALSVAPAWLREDLIVSLSRLGGSDQRRWVAAILSADERFVDEIAFVVAHSARADLRNSLMEPSMLEHNARLIYERAAELPYVEVLEGPDYTTLRYAGQGGPVEIPKEIYYWYVVHPRIEDESPVYLDPESNATTPPPAGWFWREYYYSQSEELCPTELWCSEDPWATAGPCPVLRDMLMQETVLWEGKRNRMVDNGAVGAVMGWVRGSLCFGAGSERPNQPMRIYHLHRGNCGEWADVTAAALRAALIPAVNVAAYANDHTWNEFFDGEVWRQIEPVNNMVDSPSYDKDGEEGPGWWWLYATYFTRGDGWTVNNQDFYSDENCLLEVSVADSQGQPVEGARVISGSWAIMGFVPHFLGVSDEEGRVEAVLGDHNEYNLMVLSPIGDVGAESPVKVIAFSEAGQSYAWNVVLDGSVPDWGVEALDSDHRGEERIDLSFDFPSRWLSAMGLVAGLEFSLKREGGRVRAALLPPEQCAKLRGGEQASGVLAPVEGSGSFGVEVEDASGWCALLSNESSLIATSAGRLSLTVQACQEMRLMQEEDVLLRPGERALFQIGE